MVGFGVGGAGFEEIVVGAIGGDFSGCEKQDPGGLAEEIDAVGDEDGGGLVFVGTGEDGVVDE